MEGTIIKAISGFYYVRSGENTYACRARGVFRKQGQSPLVGDRVVFDIQAPGSGIVQEIHPRKNFLLRPAVANIDLLIMLASAVIPVTDPFLIDCIAVKCERIGCGFMLLLNKCDIDPADELAAIYTKTPYACIKTSCLTGQGIELLRNAIRGKICCFTGNSGVGKSSILNTLAPQLSLETCDVSYKLGRGKHTTRHVEFFDIGDGTFIADTPGFATLEDSENNPIRRQELPTLFPEFEPYIGQCRFLDCTHRNEPECAVREATEAGYIHPSRYRSYKLLYEEAAKIKEWELK